MICYDKMMMMNDGLGQLIIIEVHGAYEPCVASDGKMFLRDVLVC